MLLLLLAIMLAAFATWVALGVEDELFQDEYQPVRYQTTSPHMMKWEDGLPGKQVLPWLSSGIE